MIEQAIRNKIEELIARAHHIPTSLNASPETNARSRAWLVEAQNVVELAVPLPSNAYRRAIDNPSRIGRPPYIVSVVALMLEALLGDIDAGLIGNLANAVRAETFDDFLDHAAEYLKNNRKNEAGVIAGVVFEDTVRRIARDNDLPEKDVSLENLINALTKTMVIKGLQSKQAKVASHVRTKATHAQWDEFDDAGVRGTISLTKTFLREHLGG